MAPRRQVQGGERYERNVALGPLSGEPQHNPLPAQEAPLAELCHSPAVRAQTARPPAFSAMRPTRRRGRGVGCAEGSLRGWAMTMTADGPVGQLRSEERGRAVLDRMD